ncbi:MAG: hypothetical protein HOJ57_39025 [Lentisphaerae bacterium]|nr:hypothetical protein [Lentisphaerota bacterium]MBT4815541.1 hypothetical protein [Lentisphaerota bacterium]MBT5611998.1 hypothetical protein [Lentisphaerota bacterium]
MDFCFEGVDTLVDGTVASRPAVCHTCASRSEEATPDCRRWLLSVPAALDGCLGPPFLDESRTYTKTHEVPPWGYCGIERIPALIHDDLVMAEDCMGEPCVVCDVACGDMNSEASPVSQASSSPTQRMACLGVRFGLLLIPQEVALYGSASDAGRDFSRTHGGNPNEGGAATHRSVGTTDIKRLTADVPPPILPDVQTKVEDVQSSLDEAGPGDPPHTEPHRPGTKDDSIGRGRSLPGDSPHEESSQGE